MATQPCTCSILKEKVESLKTTVQKLLAENVKLQVENGKFRQPTENDLLRESEQLEGSITNSIDGQGNKDGTEEKDGIQLKMVDGIFHMADGDNLAPQVRENGISSSNECAEDEPNGLECSDGEELSQASDDSVWSIKGAWKCAICLKTIRGNRANRLEHIAVHKNLKISCPFDGCNKTFSMKILKTKHIPRHHKIKWEVLCDVMKEQIRSDGAQLMTEFKKCEREYFPAKNISEVVRSRNVTCKKCGANVVSRNGQADHVAAHLKLQLACPAVECDKRHGQFVYMYEHFRKAHAQLILTQERRDEWDGARKLYHSAIAEARESYF